VRDLSLHILDLIENSIRAHADIIAITIDQQVNDNRLRIIIEDNGPGLNIPQDQATDPFYTTKQGKRTGLGLSFFQASAKQAGGTLTLQKSELGGLAVEAVMQLNHIDRLPLGDLSATLFSIALTNPNIDLWCRLVSDDQKLIIKLSQIADNLPPENRTIFQKAKIFSEKIKTTLTDFQI